MSNLDLALTAATVLLFVFGLRALLSKDGHQYFGFGYGILAGLCLSWLFKDEVGGFGMGLRLGAGLLLLLPAVKAVLQPQGKSIFFATVTLVIAVLIAGTPARKVYETYVPGAVPEAQRELRRRMVDSEKALLKLAELRAVYQREYAHVEDTLEGYGSSKAEILAHPEGEAKAKRLHKVSKLLTALDEKETLLNVSMKDMEIELAKLEVAGKEDSGLSAEDPALRAAIRELELAGPEPELGSIEDLMSRSSLEEFLESELGVR